MNTAFSDNSNGESAEPPIVRAKIIGTGEHKKGGLKIKFDGSPAPLHDLVRAAEVTFGPIHSSGSDKDGAFVVAFTDERPQKGERVLGHRPKVM